MLLWFLGWSAGGVFMVHWLLTILTYRELFCIQYDTLILVRSFAWRTRTRRFTVKGIHSFKKATPEELVRAPCIHSGKLVFTYGGEAVYFGKGISKEKADQLVESWKAYVSDDRPDGITAKEIFARPALHGSKWAGFTSYSHASFIEYFRNTKPGEREVPGIVFQAAKLLEGRGETMGGGAMMLAYVFVMFGQQALFDMIRFSVFTVVELTVGVLGLFALFYPLFRSFRIRRLLQRGVVYNAIIDQVLDEPKDGNPEQPVVVVRLVNTNPDIPEQYHIRVNQTNRFLAKEVQHAEKTVSVLVDEQLEKRWWKLPDLPQCIVLDFLPIDDRKFAVDTPKTWRKTKWIAILAALGGALCISLFRYSCGEVDVYANQAKSLMLALLILCAVVIACSGWFLIWSGQKGYNLRSKIAGLLGICAVGTLAAASFLASNIYFNPHKPVRCELVIEELFVVETPEGSKCYASFRCPAEIRDHYDFVLLPRGDFSDELQARGSLAIQRYHGFWSIPYYKSSGHIKAAVPTEMKRELTAERVRSARGYFKNGSASLKALHALGIMVDEQENSPKH